MRTVQLDVADSIVESVPVQLLHNREMADADSGMRLLMTRLLRSLLELREESEDGTCRSGILNFLKWGKEWGRNTGRMVGFGIFGAFVRKTYWS